MIPWYRLWVLQHQSLYRAIMCSLYQDAAVSFGWGRSTREHIDLIYMPPLTVSSHYFEPKHQLIAKGKASELSTAVVFLPQHTLNYGKCGSDKCYCLEVHMY
jgi:hypothetical protein